jgi:hypothetical protein
LSDYDAVTRRRRNATLAEDLFWLVMAVIAGGGLIYVVLTGSFQP